ncbi:hypothetical protein [Burkholderia dolosa]|uniref:hypothetical protein n=1 Tax=Burkholderia dolosa TaxID=152500 RepID=UPI001C987E2B|nr:hypothetical protein [Burkholderia dolosa]MBY4834137.1 hypothetical protein [Burkholderia dolosa]
MHFNGERASVRLAHLRPCGYPSINTTRDAVHFNGERVSVRLAHLRPCGYQGADTTRDAVHFNGERVSVRPACLRPCGYPGADTTRNAVHLNGEHERSIGRYADQEQSLVGDACRCAAHPPSKNRHSTELTAHT